MIELFALGVVVLVAMAASGPRTSRAAPPPAPPGASGGGGASRAVLSDYTTGLSRLASTARAAVESAPTDGPRGGRSAGAVYYDQASGALAALDAAAWEVLSPELLTATLFGEAVPLAMSVPTFLRDSDGVMWILAIRGRGLFAWGQDHFGADGPWDVLDRHAMCVAMGSEFAATGGTDQTSALLWELDWPRAVRRGGLWRYEGRGSDWVALGAVPERVRGPFPGEGPERTAARAATARLNTLRSRWPFARATPALASE